MERDSMSAGERVCRLEELTVGKGREFVVGGLVVAVFRTEEGLYAIDGVCGHAGGPLAQGMVRGDVVTCPWHGWQYNVASGCHQLNARMQQKRYSVTVVKGDVFVDVAQ